MKKSTRKLIIPFFLVIIVLLAGSYQTGILDPILANFSAVDEQIEEVITDVDEVEAVELSIGNITEDMLDRSVIIEGDVVDYTRTNRNHFFTYLDDGTGKIQVPIFNTFDIDVKELEVADRMKIAGKVELYAGELQVMPHDKGSIQITAQKKKETIKNDAEKNDNTTKSSNQQTTSKKPNNHPLKSEIGKVKTLTGEITKYSPVSGGHIFVTLKTIDGYEILLPLFNNLSPEKLPLSQGEEILVSGKIAEYEGEIEILINNMSDIQVLSARSSNDGYKKIQSIDSSQLGKKVELRGSLDELFVSDKGTVFSDLSDGTGTIDLVLFAGSPSYDEIRRVIEQEVYSSRDNIVITGEVNEYRGNLQIIIEKVRVK